MNNWCEYWSNSRLMKLPQTGGFRLYKENDSLDFFIDSRPGRTQGMIFLFATPGTKGSTMARGDEADFLESFLGAFKDAR